MILTLDNLSLQILNRKLFDNISISLLPGSISLLCGVNGIGKTSLLRAIAGLITPNEGDIYINNININDIEKPYVNYIGHNIAVKLELTVIENIERFTVNYNSQLRILAALNYFNLIEVADELCHRLSAGNRRKVALCRLLACPAKIWLLDEIDNNLDEDNRRLLINCMSAHASNGGIILYSTHDLVGPMQTMKTQKIILNNSSNNSDSII